MPYAGETISESYPAELSKRYYDALDQKLPPVRHEHLLRLGVESLRYFAALAFADYRRQRFDRPVAPVQTRLANFPFVGHYRDLLKACLDATAPPSAFGRRALNRLGSRQRRTSR